MIMSMYKKICITDRKLVSGDLAEKIGSIAQSDVSCIILREKDLSEEEYDKLARKIVPICEKNGKICILHTFTETAKKLGNPYIHLTMDDLRKLGSCEKSFFKLIGASAHTAEEAAEAEKLGADYVTISNIYNTDCKKGLEGKGTGLIKKAVEACNIDVYALGGIHPDNIDECISAGAAGVCMMSEYMKD